MKSSTVFACSAYTSTFNIVISISKWSKWSHQLAAWKQKIFSKEIKSATRKDPNNSSRLEASLKQSHSGNHPKQKSIIPLHMENSLLSLFSPFYHWNTMIILKSRQD